VKKDILTLAELDKSEFDLLFKRAGELKKRRKKGIIENSLAGKSLGLYLLRQPRSNWVQHLFL